MMTHVDYVIGFVLIISTILIIIYFVSNSISNNINDIQANEIRESLATLENYLFRIKNNSLIDSFNEIQAFFVETNNTVHSELISVSITPQVEKIVVYDNLWSEISSSSNQLPGKTELSFTMSFNPNEKKTVKIIYLGSADSIEIGAGSNMSSRLLSEKEISIVSQKKCSELQGISYQDFKNTFDFSRQFRLDSDACSYGSSPPLTTSIYIKNVPILFEDSNGLIKTGFARLSVW